MMTQEVIRTPVAVVSRYFAQYIPVSPQKMLRAF